MWNRFGRLSGLEDFDADVTGSRDTTRAGTRDTAGAGIRNTAGVGTLRAPGLGTQRESGVGTMRAPGLGTQRASGHCGCRDSGHSGRRDSGHCGCRDSGHCGCRDSGHSGRRDSGHSARRDSGQNERRDSGHSAIRDKAGVVTRETAGVGSRDTAGVGTPRRGGTRDSAPAAKAQEGREEKWVVFQKKVCHGRSLNTGGGGLPNPTESTMWGMELGGRGLQIEPHGAFRTPEEIDWWEWACQLDSWENGGGNGEMDEGSEGRSGVTVGGSTTAWGENPGQSPLCVAHGVPPALPRERQCNRETLFFEKIFVTSSRGRHCLLRCGTLLWVGHIRIPVVEFSVGSWGASLPPSVWICCAAACTTFMPALRDRGEYGWLTRGGIMLVPTEMTRWLRHVRPHCGRTRAAVLVPIRPEERAVGAAWDLTESVGLMREASRRGFARDRVLERSARRAPSRRSVLSSQGERARRRVGCPWIPLRSECEGMRRDQSSPGHFHKIHDWKFAIMPPPRRGRCEGGKLGTRALSWGIGALALGRKGGYLHRGLGTRDGISRWAVKGGTEANLWNHDTPRHTLTPDWMLPRTDSERPVRENPEGRKGGSVPRVEDPTVCHLRRRSEKDAVAVLFGAPPALPHPQPPGLREILGAGWPLNWGQSFSPHHFGRVGPLAGTNSELWGMTGGLMGASKEQERTSCTLG